MAEAAGQVYIRRNLWELERPNVWEPITLGYARAVRVMQSRAASDPTSWAYQAGIHGSYAAPPAGATWNQCQHASWFFLSWHRIYVYWFERIVRSIVVSQGGPADWALPYWNYSDPKPGYQANTLPPALRQPNLPDGSPNPLYVPAPNRASAINAGAALPASATSYAAAYRSATFVPLPRPGFGGGRSGPIHFENSTGGLENQPHNIVHDLVGGPSGANCQQGWMSDPNCAAQDPVFWLHHSNIDRLWVNWLAQGGGRRNPSDTLWLQQLFTFHDEHGASVQMKGQDILDTIAQLHYRYDDTLPTPPSAAAAGEPVQPTPEPAIAGGNSENLLAASQAPIRLEGQPVSASLDLGDAAKETIRTLSAAPSVSGRTYLNVEDIQAEQNPGVIYAVYLNLPQAGQPANPEPEHLVGYVTFFGVQHAHGGGEPGHPAGGVKHTYDITDLVSDLRARGRWDEDNVTVTFVPVGPEPAPGTETIAAAAGPVPSAQIGRVTFTSE